MHYGTHVPVAASTLTGTDIHAYSSQQEDSYQQIIPGIPHGSLYPALSSLSSGVVALDTDVQSLCDKVTKGLDKYTSLMSETREQVNKSSQNNLITAK